MNRTSHLQPRLRALDVALSLFLTVFTFFGVPTIAQENPPWSFDARNLEKAKVVVFPGAAQLEAEQNLRSRVADLQVTWEATGGTARKVVSATGYLTAPRAGDAQALALEFVARERTLLGLTEQDLANYEITDSVVSRVTGATHLYLRQLHRGIPVYGGQLQVNVNREGRILSVNNAFTPDLARAVNAHRPALDAAGAVDAAAEHLGIDSPAAAVETVEPSLRKVTRILEPHLSRGAIRAELSWLPIRAGQVHLVWTFRVDTLDGHHRHEFNVDAHNGKVWTRYDLVSAADYRVYEQPVESPQHTTPLPPADARSLVVNPADSTASPLGWHDTGTTSYTVPRGNNVHAFEDRDGNQLPPASEPSCGASLSCDFPLNLGTDPGASISAAVTNAFYWANLVHDVQYQYGFDEAAGNFQVNNFGNGGTGNDDVRLLVQQGADGTLNCGAFFDFVSDGTRPRMRMYTCDFTSPERDGALDNGVLVHEYGHGISTRQVGGPSMPGCLNNNQTPGEGWSDFFALAYTAEPGQLGTDPRGIGSYLFNLPSDGTIRDLPYSTDPAINNWTYQSIAGASIPHGVGSRWTQALWEVYWALVGQHGFDPDLHDSLGGSGNQRMLFYVNEGLKNTACSPTFLDARDGILQAVTDNFGGKDLCTVWNAFAAFGLGTDATTPGPGSTSATNGFAVPAACAGNQPPVCVDDHLTTPKDTDLSISLGALLGNDSDPDGDAVKLWSYDLVTDQGGTNDTGHIGGFNYTPPGGFTGTDRFSYTIADRGDGSGLFDTCNVFIDVTGASPPKAEVGAVTNLTHAPRTVFFNQTYTNPVVIAQPPSYNGSHTSVVRITQVLPDRFTFYVHEAPNMDGAHTTETVSYLVVEAGDWQLDNGALLRAGTVNTSSTVGHLVSNTWTTVNYGGSFTQIPVVLSQVQTNNDPYWVKTRQNAVGGTSFQVALEEDEASATSHGAETVGWIAITPGTGTWNGVPFVASRTSNAVTHAWYTVNFSSVGSSPHFLASMHTYDGAHNAGLRYQNLGTSSVQVRVEEDTTFDTETNHTTEAVNYLVFGGSGILHPAGN